MAEEISRRYGVMVASKKKKSHQKKCHRKAKVMPKAKYSIRGKGKPTWLALDGKLLKRSRGLFAKQLDV